MSRILTLSEYEWLPTHNVTPSTIQGATVTPGNNVASAWVDLYTTPLVGDYHAIEIVVYGIGASTLAKDALLDIGWDPAGGTNYGATPLTLISNLLVSYASSVQGQFGLRFFIPVLIPSGATLGVRAQTNNATVGTAKVFANLYKAKRPKDAFFGTQVISYGAVPASSCGTDITVGSTGALGTWTLIGTVSTFPPKYMLWTGARKNSGAFSSSIQRFDVGFGSTTLDVRLRGVNYGSSGTVEDRWGTIYGSIVKVGNGENIYIRGSTSDANLSYTAMAWGVI